MVYSKVKAGAAGAGLTGFLVAMIVAALGTQGIELGPEILVIITSGVAAVLSFISGYFRYERVRG